MRQKLNAIREPHPQRRGFRWPREGVLRGSDHRVRRRRPRLVQPAAATPSLGPASEGSGENEITEPFRTRDGWHIVQLLGRRQFDNTDEPKRAPAAEAIRESAASTKPRSCGCAGLRDEAYVEYKL